METKRVLITGGSGFIGRNIISAASEKGWETVSIDRYGDSIADKSVKGSVEDFDILSNTTKNVDYVFHEAAVTSPPQFEDEGRSSFSVNVIGTLNVLKAASLNGVRRVILASSSSVYGDLSVPGREDMQLPDFENLYPLSKSINEQTAAYFSKRGEVETVCLRYFNTYGIGENSKGPYSSVISKFINDLKLSKSPVIFGDGNQSRDFVYIKDVTRANILASEKDIKGGVYNIGTGTSSTFIDIFKIVKSEMKSPLNPKYAPIPFRNYQLFTQADTSKARKELGFQANYDIERGVQDMLKESN